MFDNKASKDISTISIQVLEIITSLEYEINEILSSILFAKANIIHPSIISLNKLYQDLLLSNHARSNKQLVLPVTIHNINSILDSAQLSACVYSDRLVYILDFPLIKSEPLKLYHIYSTPIQHPNSSLYTTILPEHKFLATNPSGELYISTSSLDHCKTFAEKKSVCNDLITYDADTRPICELQVLFGASKKIPSTCTSSTFAAQINTFQSLDDNRWLYILTNLTPCVLQCDDEISHHQIQGSGIINLKENCKLHTGYSTLTAHRSKKENTTSPIVIPQLDIQDCIEENKNVEIPYLFPISINEVPLDSLNNIKNQLNNQNEEIQKFKRKPFIERNQNGFSWFTIITGSLVLLIILYVLLKKYMKLQRQHHHGKNHCIQIFNNCLGSSRRRTTRVHAIPMATIRSPAPAPSCISEDEDDSLNTTQRSDANVQSLF
ncbi:PREDICTED: uncharacterized protein LOC106116643 [Papilio xuthus]|uniref:Uncharacterized protein LOC106116643 n=1 Tax=Papilio xuthus TaxID=66420 RepID=A0AAJ7E7H1_PAPXU|nr:PREDICTED: uncharacterized protein LOC106116643 [Papilio xuthus]